MSVLKPLHINKSGMAFDPETGESYQLNDSAIFIMTLLQQGLSSEEVAKKLAMDSHIAYEKALTDVLEFQVQINVIGLAA